VWATESTADRPGKDGEGWWKKMTVRPLPAKGVDTGHSEKQAAC